jgi:ribonuclease BN (tRNA processing enzyme)
VISGDTAPAEVLVEKARGCDVLIHEVYSVAGLQTRPPSWQRYHTHMHTSSHELAQIAAQIRPELLILYHQLFWNVSEKALLAEVTSHYDGLVVSGRDLDVY